MLSQNSSSPVAAWTSGACFGASSRWSGALADCSFTGPINSQQVVPGGGVEHRGDAGGEVGGDADDAGIVESSGG